jgi:hypothetical protein
VLVSFLFVVGTAAKAEESAPDKDFQKNYQEYSDFQKKEAERAQKEKNNEKPPHVPINDTTRIEPQADPYGVKVIKTTP